MYLWNFDDNNSWGDKVNLFNFDKAEKMCTAEKIYVTSLYGDNMIIFEPKMQVKQVPLKYRP